jgi:hypothetical protein
MVSAMKALLTLNLVLVSGARVLPKTRLGCKIGSLDGTSGRDWHCPLVDLMDADLAKGIG